MNVVYAGQPLPTAGPSIFLAGPTPRSKEVSSWRPMALDLLGRLGFEGGALVPERPDWAVRFEYQDQVEWEHAGLESCSVVVFWVPRDMFTLAGFTTNVEFGRYVGRKPCVYGRPEGAPHTRYLDWLYTRLTGMHPQGTLHATLAASVVAVRSATNQIQQERV
ncbi:MAG: nucleoside 2-deoxyribosyltransferase domain-containing protein [Gemmataceae bacterium]